MSNKKFYIIKRHFCRFYKENLFLSILSLFSLAFIIFYYFSYDTPEIFHNAHLLVDFIFQLSLAIIANLIFLIFQIYIPSCKRFDEIYPFALKKIQELCETINKPFTEMSIGYLKKEKNLDELSDADIEIILKNYSPYHTITFRNITYGTYFQSSFNNIDSVITELLSVYEPYLYSETKKFLILCHKNTFRKFFSDPSYIQVSNIYGTCCNIEVFKEYQSIYNYLIKLTHKM